MTNSKPLPAMTSASPFFIVRSITQSLAFYGESLGFHVAFRAPDVDPFFAIVRRDGVQLFSQSSRRRRRTAPELEAPPSGKVGCLCTCA
jgi:catechol 2,3-dioxygenase-like lactoylglutathione lyase family enzyme